VKLLRREKRAGFASNNNVGARQALGKYLFFLNPDTILTSGSLKILVEFMEKRGAAACGPKLLNLDGTPQENARRFPHPLALLLRGLRLHRLFKNTRLYTLYLMEDMDHDKVFEVDWLLGAALLVRRDVFEQMKGFDEGYPLYYEDVDLCMRIKKAGYCIYYVPQAIIYHHYLRESAKLLNKKTLFHTIGILRFFLKKGLCRLR
jgi:hypothetical protein